MLSLTLAAAACSAAVPAWASPPLPGTRQVSVPLGFGATLHVEVIGSGPEVVIVPGRHLLGHALAELARPSRTLVFYDMRNRGLSAPAPLDQVSVEHDLSDLDRLVRQFGDGRVSLIGYSYMGMLVTLYASRHPDVVERLVQIGPAPRVFGTEYPMDQTARAHPPVYPPEEGARFEALSKTNYPETHPREFCELTYALTRYELVGRPENVGRVRNWCDMPNEQPVNFRRFAEKHFPTLQAVEFPLEQLTKVSMPVLTIHGTWDRNAPYGSGREWVATLPDARLLTLEGAGHNAWEDYPAEVLSALDIFLNGGWPAAAERLSMR